MRWIVQTSLRYRYLVIFLAVVLMIFGIDRLRNSAVDVFPEFAPPRVEVQTLSMGLSATDVEELVTVDMAVVGKGQESDEFNATLCIKDGGGPYHFGLNNKLRALAEKYDIPYKTDVYVFYGSDGEAFWRAGGDVALALIGPGIDASHNYERTHTDGLIATTNWIMAYLSNN